jgi:ferredoxin
MGFFSKNVRVVVRNQNLSFEVKSGTNLYKALVSENVIQHTLCKGNGQCGKCKVHVDQKRMPKPTKKEQLVLARINLEAGFRLACQTTIKDDVVINTSEITTSTMPADVVLRPVINEEPILPEAEQALPEETLTLVEVEAEAPVELTETPQPLPEQTFVPVDTPPEEDNFPEPVSPKLEAIGEKDFSAKREQAYAKTDGLLLVSARGKLRYFLHSAVIDTISEEGNVENVNLKEIVENGLLSDFIHDTLKINDVERVLILTDEHDPAGENLFNAARYRPFDIGSMQCEIISPAEDLTDLSLFMRILSIKGKRRLLIPLDRLESSYYFAEGHVISIPGSTGFSPGNMYTLSPVLDNPITSISDNFSEITVAKEYAAPDSITLPVLLKLAGGLIKKHLADGALYLHPRGALDSSIPLEYVVKVTRVNDENAFYLYRDKDSSLLITQSILTKLQACKEYIHQAVDYVKLNIGQPEAIILSTPVPTQNLLEDIKVLELVPAEDENITVNTPGDPSVKAVKLFHEPDVRSYIRKHFGSFSRLERK